MRLQLAVCAAVLALLSGCGDPACVPEAHCVVSERVAGTCQCTEWETVAVETLDVPYVVAAVVYPVAGNHSSVHYGGDFTADDIGTFTLAPVGARWRTRVRGADGIERGARALSGVSSSTGWRLDDVTPETVALTAPAARPTFHPARVDVPTHAWDDLLAVWVNARATVETDYAGGLAVRWSVSPGLPECDGDPLQVAWLTPGQLLDGDPAADACAAAFLATLDAGQRAAVAGHDVFFSPEGREPQSIFDAPRYEVFENSSISRSERRTTVYTWSCLEPLRDEDAIPLARSEAAMADGATLVVEHTILAAGSSCPPRNLAVIEFTDTEDCRIQAAVELDLAFGTVFHVAGTQWEWSGSAVCTR